LEQLNQFYDANVGEPYFNLEEANQDLEHGHPLGLTQGQLNKLILELLISIDLLSLSKLYFE